MEILQRLANNSARNESPFLISDCGTLTMEQVLSTDLSHLSAIQSGDVVALIGDFNAISVAELFFLVERKAIIVPLTVDTRPEHDYFLENALVDWIVEDGVVERRKHSDSHAVVEALRQKGSPGLVFFSTGTTGRPKAILHDMNNFLRRFETPRPSLRTMAFLLFDHIGGINTLFHTIFNFGVVVAPTDRSVGRVLDACRRYRVEALPTTPTFLRMMLMSGAIPEKMPRSLKVVTYGTERMDQPTLNALNQAMPEVDFRQTYGMSEVGILRVKSKSKSSLFMKIGGEGVSTRVKEGVLEILSPTRMVGYLNAESPFDEKGWYNTGDIVELEGDFIRVIGRDTEVINVGGLKFMASEVERVALQHPSVALVSVKSRPNPVTGEHVEMAVEAAGTGSLDLQDLKDFLSASLPSHMLPLRITVQGVSVSHRYKRS